ncbi:MAG TPA: hypothetical protein VMR81_01370 [Patescibacteria group bacterium]|nr:hypothetical protein [Patescibacteria group bacterium]
MLKPEDFERMLRNRPQQVGVERTELESYSKQQEVTYNQNVLSKQLQEAQAKADLLKCQTDLIKKFYQEAGIQQRIITIASLISGGKIITDRSLDDSNITLNIPYHSFTGRMIIHDPSMDKSYSSFGTMQSGSSSLREEGQKLSAPTTLHDRIYVNIDCSIQPNPLRLYFKVWHMQWQQEKMTNTGAIFHRTGWVEHGIGGRDWVFSENEWLGPDGCLVDAAFTDAYDSYLAITGQI